MTVCSRETRTQKGATITVKKSEHVCYILGGNASFNALLRRAKI